jgi:hypothetical protein
MSCKLYYVHSRHIEHATTKAFSTISHKALTVWNSTGLSASRLLNIPETSRCLAQLVEELTMGDVHGEAVETDRCRDRGLQDVEQSDW